MIDSKLQQKIDFISEYIVHLDSLLKEFSLDEFDLIKWEAMERMAEKIIESAITINKKILLSHEIMVQNYYETFSKLQDLHIFDESLLSQLAKTTGFRNRLAHDYLDLDRKIAFDSMKKLPGLYIEYVKQMVIFLSK